MNQKVLFLCPHNAAKSVIAATYFNRMAHDAGLALVGDSAGTEPSENVSPVVAAMMSDEHIDLSHYKPRLVTPDELQSSTYVISIGCTPQELGTAAERVEYWDDVPLVSEDAEGARAAIYRHIEELVDRMCIS